MQGREITRKKKKERRRKREREIKRERERERRLGVIYKERFFRHFKN